MDFPSSAWKHFLCIERYIYILGSVPVYGAAPLETHLTRLAYPMDTGPDGRNGTLLVALQKFLAARLSTSPLPWAVRAPALLLCCVIGSSVTVYDHDGGERAIVQAAPVVYFY